MSKGTALRSRSRRAKNRSTPDEVPKRVRDHLRDAQVTAGAAAAERASAGMGTAENEPTDWLFGDSLTPVEPRPY